METPKASPTACEASSAPGCSALLVAFVQGASWWEYRQTGGTMWQSDRRIAEEEAERREKNGTLGVLPPTESAHEPEMGSAKYNQMRDALESARDLILMHHSCSIRVEPGQMCPHCCEADGSSPKMDKIWAALARPNPTALTVPNETAKKG